MWVAELDVVQDVISSFDSTENADFKIRLENESQVGTPLRQNLLDILGHNIIFRI